MATEQLKKTCTSERFIDPENKGKYKPCGLPLLQIVMADGGEPALICEHCDALESLPKDTRGRVFEQ